MKPGNGLFYDPLGPSSAAGNAAGTPAATATSTSAPRSGPPAGHGPDSSLGGSQAAARQVHPDAGRGPAREAALLSVRRDLERLARLRMTP
ncbi:hypothetical protein [Arthrobacter sp. AZCC_0090]|uniref:hypothetical protein n=1 Tax=Arthrobacter sp. AZCC_0090 TaxID=2735881 RepID=UPI00160A064E|nr:hypothetical protein [Arthrobacter sp. AZCC_0090]MBB6405896.1 hypothetical protein [Arthrobacter sp. AZCC_0090]